ncbi:hypothetical protein BYT27DRAFT_7334408 [Phlegmacium glaucopus]|nr:hypothetical protein BYT27DRAFT_7334408 [Phlegmacium glaucopus]
MPSTPILTSLKILKIWDPPIYLRDPDMSVTTMLDNINCPSLVELVYDWISKHDNGPLFVHPKLQLEANIRDLTRWVDLLSTIQPLKKLKFSLSRKSSLLDDLQNCKISFSAECDSPTRISSQP